MARQNKGPNGNGSNLEKVGALWKNVSADGQPYFTLLVKEQKYIVFYNSYKSEEKQPDFLVYERLKEQEK